MEKYLMIKEVGSGTYGSVWKALSKPSGEVVAIKKIKKQYHSWEECLNLREVKVLRKLNHLNIVKLKGVIRENSVLYFVFEYMEHDLRQLMRSRGSAASEAEVRNWCFQVFQGLTYLHQRGYVHRDIKPGNLLVSNDHVKIADFGMVREFNSQPPFTQCVGTRRYRAPEIMLQSPIYGPPVDMWAMGATMAELFTCEPLFRGSSEADQIYKICRVLGSPTRDAWPEGLDLASAINYQFPQATGVCLSSLIPGASKDAINLIASLCSWDPRKRPTAMEALQHPFFQSCSYLPASLHSKPVLAFMDLNDYSVTPNDKNQENIMKQQSKYYPPGMDGYNGYMGIAPDDKLGVVPSINAGGWDRLPDLFKQQRQELLAGRW